MTLISTENNSYTDNTLLSLEWGHLRIGKFPSPFFPFTPDCAGEAWLRIPEFVLDPLPVTLTLTPASPMDLVEEGMEAFLSPSIVGISFLKPQG